MAAITKDQIKRIYALGSAIGILERGSKDDDLHALVFNIAGKASISELSAKEFSDVERELIQRMRYVNRTAPLQTRKRPKSEDPITAGAMTEAQKRMAWRMIYRLCELDGSQAAPGERMRGAVRKILGIDGSLRDPMAWVKFEDGGKLIEQLKRYVRSAERKKKEAG